MSYISSTRYLKTVIMLRHCNDKSKHGTDNINALNNYLDHKLQLSHPVIPKLHIISGRVYGGINGKPTKSSNLQSIYIELMRNDNLKHFVGIQTLE